MVGMDYKERRAKRLERYKRLLIIQKLFSVAILASIAVSAGMFNIIKTPKVILDIINYDTELVVNVEVDPNESKVKEESLKLVVKDGYEKHNYPLRFGKNTIYQADMKYNWEYRLDVLADWGMGQGTIISKRYTTRKDIPRPGKRISKESLHVNSLTYISNYGLVGAASIVENDNITTTYSELISFNIKDKDGKSFEGKVPFNEMVNQDIFFVPIANLDLENSLDVKYTFSGKYINSDWTEETFKSNDIPINKIETMTYNQVPDSYISVSSQADSLNYIEINSGKLYGPKPMIKTDNNVYRINVDNLEKAKQTAYVSYYKKDGKIYLYASIRNLYIIEEPQNLITEVPKYLSSSKEIILEYIAERNIVSMDTLIYRNGVQIYSSIKDTPVTGKRYIKSINYNYTAGDRVSVLFYEHQDSPSSLLKQYIVDFSKSESFVSNTTNLASLSFNVFADNISEGNYEAVIVDKDGVCSAPKN